MRSCFLLLATIFLVATSLCAQKDPEPRHRDRPADAAELAAITERGRAIADYDTVAWHATDAVQALHPKEDAVEMYIGKKVSQGWLVVFGKLNARRDTFLLAYQTDPTGDVVHPRVAINTPPSEDRTDWLFEARAFELARAALKIAENQPYNGTVLPSPNGGWYVYFYPAQTDANTFPTGADTRFLVSHEGLSIVETHRMHVGLLQNDLRSQGKDGKIVTLAGTYHMAILDDAPEDTDVSNAILMKLPMFIVTRSFTYRIDASGNVAYDGPSPALGKKPSK